MIERSAITLNNYEHLQFLDEKSKVFLEKVSVTNLIDCLSFSPDEIEHLMSSVPEYKHLERSELLRVFRNRGSD